jgi:hypothetical protein
MAAYPHNHHTIHNPGGRGRPPPPVKDHCLACLRAHIRRANGDYGIAVAVNDVAAARPARFRNLQDLHLKALFQLLYGQVRKNFRI